MGKSSNSMVSGFGRKLEDAARPAPGESKSRIQKLGGELIKDGAMEMGACFTSGKPTPSCVAKGWTKSAVGVGMVALGGKEVQPRFTVKQPTVRMPMSSVGRMRTPAPEDVTFHTPRAAGSSFMGPPRPATAAPFVGPPRPTAGLFAGPPDVAGGMRKAQDDMWKQRVDEAMNPKFSGVSTSLRDAPGGTLSFDQVLTGKR